MNLNGKKVLVTGGAVRLGRAICETLAAHGCTVIIHYNRSAAEAEALAVLLSGAGGKAYCVQALLENEDDCRRLISGTIALAGGLDILVNNASVFNKDPLMDADALRLHRELEINAFVPMYLTRAFAGHCLPQSNRLPEKSDPVNGAGAPVGKVINLLDRRVAGLEKGALPYLLSKKLLCDYTQLAALELGPQISVNAVAPGPVLPPPGQGTAYLQDHAGPMVLGRRPSPADVAAAVVYLLEADAVTGQVLFVDGGQHLL